MNYRRAGKEDVMQLTALRMAYLEEDYGVLDAKIYEAIAVLFFAAPGAGLFCLCCRNRECIIGGFSFAGCFREAGKSIFHYGKNRHGV